MIRERRMNRGEKDEPEEKNGLGEKDEPEGEE